MWGASGSNARFAVALEVGDPDVRDALAEALEDHPALEAAAEAEADVVVADRAIPAGRAPVLRIGADGPPADAGADLILSAAHLLAAGFRLAPGPVAAAAPRAPGLSPRERAALALMTDGASNKAIARALRISERTAKFHVASILAKLGARNRAEAVAMALREGLVVV